MSISQYSDDELLEEVKHRGFKIEVPISYSKLLLTGEITRAHVNKIIIGGITFELRN